MESSNASASSSDEEESESESESEAEAKAKAGTKEEYLKWKTVNGYNAAVAELYYY